MTRYGSHPALPDILTQHAAIHARANTLLELKQQGQTEAALDHFNEIETLRDTLLASLRQLLARSSR